MNLISKDAKLFVGYFKEMAKLRGIPGCQYQYITDKVKEDPRGEYVIINGELVKCTLSDYPNEVRYSIESTKSFTIHGELRAIYSDPEPICLIFQEAPTQKTLRALGWVSEDNSDGDKPYVIQIPRDTKNLQTGCRVHIPFGLYDGGIETKIFRITKVVVIAQYPDCFTCTIAPEFETDPLKSSPDYTESDGHFMRDFK